MVLKLFTLSVGLGLLWSVPAVSAQNQYGALSFSPANPTSNDFITVVFTPYAGEPDWCSVFSSVSGNEVGIIAFPIECAPGYGTKNAAAIGRLPTGSYQVIWTFTDNFFNVPVPTAQLTVTYASAQVPAASFTALVILAFGIIFIGFSSMRANYSLKRTAADELR